MISKDRLLIQQQIYNFLRTVTIKFTPIALYQNADLVSRGYAVDDRAPATWKYYRNLMGEYHVSDTQMHVVSLDTHQPILFHPSTLVHHPRTRSVYVPGGLYYKRLCETYPDQVDLIKSILFPVTDITAAIMADDFALLEYGKGFLDDYEESPLVSEMEKFLAIVEERWYFDFLDDEKYFHITFWSSLWVWLAMLLMSARESYVRTPYVHNWHLWNELRSHGLEDYSDILDRERAMMLYQNIDYLKGNAGKQSNLVILANRLLASFGVSIYSRRVLQESESGEANYQLTPQLQAVRFPTDTYNIAVEIADETVETIQSRIYSKGLTQDHTAESAAAKERKLSDTTLNRFMTKFLEIRPITKNKIYSDQLNMFLMETLVTSILEDYYTQPVTIEDNATGIVLYLYPRELLAIYHYAVQRSMGLHPTHIPNEFFLYKAFTPTVGVPEKTIWHGTEKVYVKQHFNASAVLSGFDYNTNIELPGDFTEMVTRQWLRYMDHLLLDSNTLIDRRRYILEYLMTMCHQRRVVTQQLVPGFTDYATLFGPQGLDIASSTLAQYDVQKNPSSAWGSLADAITSALIPVNPILVKFGNFTLSDFGYDRLRQLFVQMCSYRVVFLESSRVLPEFAIGAKWSNYYGPDDTLTYADKPFVVYHQHVDATSVTHDLIRHQGFVENDAINTVAVGEYTVNHTSTRVNDRAMDHRPLSVLGVSRKSSFVSHGFLNIERGSIVAGMDQDEVILTYLVDGDGHPLRDTDGNLVFDLDGITGAPASYLMDMDGVVLSDENGMPITDPDDPRLFGTVYVLDKDGKTLLDADGKPIRAKAADAFVEDSLLMDNDGTILTDDDVVDLADPPTVDSNSAAMMDSDGVILTDDDNVELIDGDPDTGIVAEFLITDDDDSIITDNDDSNISDGPTTP